MLSNRVLAVLLTRSGGDNMSPAWVAVFELTKELRMEVQDVVADLKAIYSIQPLECIPGNGLANNRYRFDPRTPINSNLVRVKAHLTKQKTESVIKRGGALVDSDLISEKVIEGQTAKIKKRTRPVISLSNAVRMGQQAFEESLKNKS